MPFPTPADILPAVPKPSKQTASKAVIREGEALAGNHMCEGCHSPGLDGSGAWIRNGAVPDLRYAPPWVYRQWDAIVLGGLYRKQGMLSFGVNQHFPDVSKLTVADSHAIRAYVISQAWKAYDAQQKKRKSEQKSH